LWATNNQLIAVNRGAILNRSGSAFLNNGD